MSSPRSTYSVLVGNIGQVYFGQDKMTAHSVFADYVNDSTRSYGRAAGEDVTVFEIAPNGISQPIREHVGHCPHI